MPSPAPIKTLRPTQLTVGMLEVEVKRKRLTTLSPARRDAFLRAHPLPTVVGPEGHPYITDHHHLARAALEARVGQVYLTVEADFSSLRLSRFWLEMNKRSWVHPLDQNGVRHDYSRIPSRLSKLTDDIYRSLAGFVRDAGGFDKTDAAFVEFVWADFFRRNIAIEDLKADFRKSVRRGTTLALSKLARRIPGFKG